MATPSPTATAQLPEARCSQSEPPRRQKGQWLAGGSDARARGPRFRPRRPGNPAPRLRPVCVSSSEVPAGGRRAAGGKGPRAFPMCMRLFRPRIRLGRRLCAQAVGTPTRGSAGTCAQATLGKPAPPQTPTPAAGCWSPSFHLGAEPRLFSRWPLSRALPRLLELSVRFPPRRGVSSRRSPAPYPRLTRPVPGRAGPGGRCGQSVVCPLVTVLSSRAVRFKSLRAVTSFSRDQFLVLKELVWGNTCLG